MKLLAIETSGRVASAAVTADGVCLAEKSVYTKLTHSQTILPMAQELLKDCGLEISDLDGVVCSKGPGSYTGLRIGIAAVKGIVMGCASVRCAGISTLESLAYGCAEHRGKICSVMKARKDLLYCAVYESDGERLKAVLPDGIRSGEQLAGEVKDGGEIVFTGDCCEEFRLKYFPDDNNKKCALFINRLQRAACLCAAFEANPEYAAPADELCASYLQETHITPPKKK